MLILITIILCLGLGYLLGSVPFGLVLVKAAGLGDIRKIGSGNIGVTNVLRTGRYDLTILTLILDIGKAAIAALLAKWILPNDQMTIFGAATTIETFGSLIAGTAAILGHNFPVWLNFKGGKGVASTVGLLFATSPFIAWLALATWLFMAFTFRYSSLAAITAAALVPLFAYILTSPVHLFFYTVLAALLIYRHKTNIMRLLTKEESKISFKKSDKKK